MSKAIKVWRITGAPRNLYLPYKGSIVAYRHVAVVGNEFGGLVIAGSNAPCSPSGWCYVCEGGGTDDFGGWNIEEPKIYRSLERALQKVQELNSLPWCLFFSPYVWVAPGEWWRVRRPFHLKVVGEVAPLYE